MTNKNIFIYGLSGSGKDTISDFLRDKFGFLKLRIAGTIKQYVFETYGFKNQEEFEKNKRENSEVRKAHNIFGSQYDKEGIERSTKEATENRIDALINKTALEFEIKYNMKDYPICIVDVRNKFEAEKLLKAGFYGIFLNRRANEFANKAHKTEQDMFLNGELFEIMENLESSNICVIFNSGNVDRQDCLKAFSKCKIKDGIEIPVNFTDGTTKDLINKVVEILQNTVNEI